MCCGSKRADWQCTCRQVAPAVSLSNFENLTKTICFVDQQWISISTGSFCGQSMIRGGECRGWGAGWEGKGLTCQAGAQTWSLCRHTPLEPSTWGWPPPCGWHFPESPWQTASHTPSLRANTTCLHASLERRIFKSLCIAIYQPVFHAKPCHCTLCYESYNHIQIFWQTVLVLSRPGPAVNEVAHRQQQNCAIDQQELQHGSSQ